MLGFFYKVYNVSSQVVLEESGTTQACTLKQMSVPAKCTFILILLYFKKVVYCTHVKISYFDAKTV